MLRTIKRYGSRYVWLMGAAMAALCASSPARADTQVNAFSGDLTSSVPIEVPAYHGLEPKLSLGYSSSAGNGIAGVGWALGGASVIERASPGRGTPTYSDTPVTTCQTCYENYTDWCWSGWEWYVCTKQRNPYSCNCTTPPPDIFLLDGNELVQDTSLGGTHSTKMQSHRRITRDTANNLWYVWERNGTKSTFSPRVTTAAGTYKWLLTSVQDTSGNVTSYDYACANNDCQLSTVTYNGTTVTFYYEARTDELSSAIGGAATCTQTCQGNPSGCMDWYYYCGLNCYAVCMTWTYVCYSGLCAGQGLARVTTRLKTVDVKTGGSRVRAYKLIYSTYGSTAPRSVLWYVQQFGKDATLDASGTVTAGTALPATAFFPQSFTWGWAAPQSQSGLHGIGVARWFVDVNGDGKADYVAKNNDGNIHWNLSTGTGWSAPQSQSGIHGIGNLETWLVDIDGDGKADYVTKNNDGCIHWNLSTGTGWGPVRSQCGLHGAGVVRWMVDINGDGKADYVAKTSDGNIHWNLSGVTSASGSSGWGANQSQAGVHGTGAVGSWLVDINGDGKPDYVMKNNDGCINWNLGIGGGWGQPQSQCGFHGIGAARWFVDINGDGRADYVAKNNDGNIHWNLSTGNGFLPNQSQAGIHGIGTLSAWFVDINGDGMVDYVTKNNDQCLLWNLSTGTGWGPAQSQCSLLGNGGYGIWFADVTGDGVPDYVTKTNDGTIHWDKNQYARPLLTDVTNGLGGTTTATYKPSSAYSSTNNSPVQQVVDSLTTSDGRGTSTTLSYWYAGSKFDFVERRFLGFRYANVVSPRLAGETKSPLQEMWFSQDYASLSMPFQVHKGTWDGTTAFSGTGSGPMPGVITLQAKLLDITTTTGAAPYTTTVTGKWAYVYDGSASPVCPGAGCIRSYVSHAYDGFGNITQEVSHGNYDVSGDERTVLYTFAPNTAGYVVNKPVETKTFAGVGTAGALLENVVLYYDGATTAGAAPTLGRLTKTARWLNTPVSSYVARTTAYDQWGNVTQEVDPLGGTTTYAYDTTYHVYPTTVTNHLNHTMTTSFDPVCSQPSWQTDPNGQTSSFTYDALCRQLTVTTPLGGYQNKNYVLFGSVGNQYVETVTPSADGVSAQWSREYFDGMGRVYLKKSRGPASNQDINQEVTYNVRGGTASTSAAYYTGEAVKAVVTTYDALDRPIKKTYPDGPPATIVTTSYELGVVTATDELGHAQQDYKDVEGRVTRHREYRDGVTTDTTFVHDLRGNLASRTDAAGTVVSYTFDSLGRKVAMSDPNSGSWTYGYDAVGRLTAQTDPKGQTTSFTYDALGRKLTKTSGAGTVTWNYDVARSGYYNKGRLTGMTGGGTTSSCTPTPLALGGAVSDGGFAWMVSISSGTPADNSTYPTRSPLRLFENGVELGAAHSVHADIRNLGQGRFSHWSTVNGTGETVRFSASDNTNPKTNGRTYTTCAGTTSATYDYDAAGRMVKATRVIGTQSYTFQETFDAGGRALTRTFPDGTTEGPLTYDAAGRPKTIPGVVTGATYDARGNLLTLTNANETTTTRSYSPTRFWLTGISTMRGTTTVQSLAYTRDVEGKVTAVVSPFADEGWSYTYDTLHQLTGATNTSDATKNQTWTYGGTGNILTNNKLGSYSYDATAKQRVTTAGSNSYTYDAAGNMVTGPGRTITWDAENRPVNVNGATMLYDGNGQRLQKTVGGLTTTYLGDDYEISSSGVVTKYVGMAGLLVAKKVGTTTSWLHVDHQGSVQVETSSTGVQQRSTYRPYGDRMQASTARGYVAQRQDESGLLFMHARYYDPVLGRFISPDAKGASGVGNVGMNRYAYAANNPVNLADTDGMGFFKSIGKFFKNILKFMVSFIRGLVNLVNAAIHGNWKAIAMIVIMVVVIVLAPEFIGWVTQYTAPAVIAGTETVVATTYTGLAAVGSAITTGTVAQACLAVTQFVVSSGIVAAASTAACSLVTTGSVSWTEVGKGFVSGMMYAGLNIAGALGSYSINGKFISQGVSLEEMSRGSQSEFAYWFRGIMRESGNIQNGTVSGVSNMLSVFHDWFSDNVLIAAWDLNGCTYDIVNGVTAFIMAPLPAAGINGAIASHFQPTPSERARGHQSILANGFDAQGAMLYPWTVPSQYQPRG
jgi:RHS repeat-associated protein